MRGGLPWAPLTGIRLLAARPYGIAKGPRLPQVTDERVGAQARARRRTELRRCHDRLKGGFSKVGDPQPASFGPAPRGREDRRAQNDSEAEVLYPTSKRS